MQLLSDCSSQFPLCVHVGVTAAFFNDAAPQRRERGSQLSNALVPPGFLTDAGTIYSPHSVESMTDRPASDLHALKHSLKPWFRGLWKSRSPL